MGKKWDLKAQPIPMLQRQEVRVGDFLVARGLVSAPVFTEES